MVMFMAKKNLTPEALKMIANRFKVLSEPIRLQILHRLQEGEMSVGELTLAVKTSQPNVSKHLKILQREGILVRNQRGNTVYYEIADETIFALCETVCDALEEKFKEDARVFELV